jgi:NTE family protein
MAAPTLRDWLDEGPFSLALSAGFFGFFAHGGVLSALEQQGPRPERVTGASAGALMAGLWSSGLPAVRLQRELDELRREEFWDPWPGLGLLRGKRFRRKLQAIVGDATFESSPMRAAVSVYDVLSSRTRVIDSGPLAPALHASCALPVLFQPVWIDRRPYSDGGILDRPGFAGLGAAPRVLYHHLASRSPWRRPGDPALKVPSRPGAVTLVVEGLPRVNPFALHLGRDAFGRARDAALRALDRPIVEGLVRV